MFRSYNIELRRPEGPSTSRNVQVVSGDTQLAARAGLVEKVEEAAVALGIAERSEQIRQAVAACTAIDGKPLVVPLAGEVSILISAQQMAGNADPVGFDTTVKDHSAHGVGASFQ